MRKIKLEIKIKDLLKSIKERNELDELEYTKVEMDNNNEKLILKYIVYPNNIVYSDKSNLYNLHIKELIEIIKKEYLVLFFGELYDKKFELIKVLIKNSNLVIPMESYCLIKSIKKKNKITFSMKNIKIQAEKITEKNIEKLYYG